MAQWSSRFHYGMYQTFCMTQHALMHSQPYMINLIAQQTASLEMLKKDNEERKAREASQQKKEEDTPILGSRLMLTQGPIGSAPSPGPYGQANGIARQPTGGFRPF